jgi:aromatic-L-amino-acid/L-tryptophan decarboxylase
MPSPSTISLDHAAMREAGYRVVDLIAEHLATLSEKRVGRQQPRKQLEAQLHEPLPAQGVSFDHVLREVSEKVLTSIMHVDHPRFMAFVPGPGNFVGAMADALLSGFNVFAGTWLGGSGAAQIELVTLDWMKQMCGLPENAGGLFLSGGSMANVTGLATARHVMLDDRIAGAAVYFSDQTHSSVERALRLLGFLPEQLVKIASDEDFRLPVKALRHRIQEDRRAGLRPFCVVANAGTTNTGAIDPLPDLTDLCRRERLWLHADGAYGAASVFSARGRAALLPALSECDSLSLDPHKWLFQPFENGCVLVRDAAMLKHTFQTYPEYLRDVPRTEEEVSFSQYGVQLTRTCRALKLWMTLKVFGADAIAEAIDRGFQNAERFQKLLEQSGCWEIVTPAQMAVVSFRYRSAPGERPSPEVCQHVVQAMAEEGYGYLSSTVLRGETVLRACPINPRTTPQDLEGVAATVTALARSLAAGA